MQQVDVDELRNLLTQRMPYGPSKSEDAGPHGGAILYDDHHGLHSRIHREQPTCLIGRKGAGKTAFLVSLSDSERAISVQLAESDLVSDFATLLNQAREQSRSVLLVVPVSRLWKVLTYHAAAHVTLKESDDNHDGESRKRIFRYLQELSNELMESTYDVVTADANEILRAVIRRWKSTVSAQRGVSASDLSDALRFGGISYKELEKSVRSLAVSLGKPVYVILDSLEDLHLRLDEVSTAIQGLLQLLGNKPGDEDPVQVFVCLPAEMLEHLRILSANPGKNLEHSLQIHWTPRELIELAARRHNLFNHAHNITGPRATELRRSLSMGSKSIIRAYGSLYPARVHNSQGFLEPSLPYILRHTQLLPRQLIRYLNAIWREALASGIPADPEVSEDDIRYGVGRAERDIVADVIGSYNGQYPWLSSVCERLIPQLTSALPMEELLVLTRDAGVTAEATGTRDARDLIQLFTEIGVVGKAVADGDTYITAKFSFNFEGSLIGRTLSLDAGDVACLHPLFSGAYDATPHTKPVYVSDVYDDLRTGDE
jgi:hypothetical protein